MTRSLLRRPAALLAVLVALLGGLVATAPAATAAGSTPVVTGLSVHSGSAAGDTWVIVHGYHLTPVSRVTFGGVQAPRVQQRSARELAVLSPTRSSGGTVHVYVYTTSGHSAGGAASEFHYVIPVPSITSMSSHFGGTYGVSGLRIYGHNLSDISRVAVGSDDVDNYTPYSSSRVDVVLPAHQQGVRHIRVYTRWGISDGTTAASEFTFYPPPTITSLSTHAGPTSGGTQVTITGNYLDHLSAVALGSATVTQVVAFSPTKLTVTTPAHAEGVVHAIVTTRIGSTERTATDRFRYGRVQSARWSDPTNVDPTRGEPGGLSCPTTTFCALADRGGMLTYDGSAWHDNPLSGDVRWVGVECYSARSCLAWGTNETTHYNGSTWSAPEASDIFETRAVGCASDTFCRVVAGDGSEYVFDGSHLSSTGDTVGTGVLTLRCVTDTDCLAPTESGTVYRRTAAGWAVSASLDTDGDPFYFASCAADGTCLAVAYHGRTFAYDGDTWHETASGPAYAQGLSCASGDYCVSVDESGAAHVRRNSVWGDATAPVAAGLPYPLSISCPAEDRCLVVSDDVGAVRHLDRGVVSAPEVVDEYRGGLTGISCATPTNCVATDRFLHAVTTHDGSAWTTPQRGIGRSVSCPTTTFCMAVGFRTASRYDGTAWQVDQNVLAESKGFQSVSCPSTSFCEAVVSDGTVTGWNGRAWSAPTRPLGSPVRGISCPAAEECAAITAYYEVLTLHGGAWRRTARLDNNGSAEILTAIDCPSVDNCQVTTAQGTVVAVTPSGVSYRYDVLGDAKVLDCATVNSCVVAGGGQVAFWDGSSWSAPVGAPSTVTSVSCPGVRHCVTTSDATVATLDW